MEQGASEAPGKLAYNVCHDIEKLKSDRFLDSDTSR
jgi:hypothetical protein